MPTPLFHPSLTGVILFSRRAARQCATGRGVPEWAVCDTIANGYRRRSGGRGALGGALVRFSRSYALGPGAGAVMVTVIGELTRKGCVAVGVAAARPRKKSRKSRDF